jgi:hypothetical protein
MFQGSSLYPSSGCDVYCLLISNLDDEKRMFSETSLRHQILMMTEFESKTVTLNKWSWLIARSFISTEEQFSSEDDSNIFFRCTSKKNQTNNLLLRMLVDKTFTSIQNEILIIPLKLNFLVRAFS